MGREVEPPDCPLPNFNFNIDTSQCECAISCNPSTHFMDDENCTCKSNCQEKFQMEGLSWPPTCKLGFMFDFIDCTCICASSYKPCPFGKKWNLKTCQCECEFKKSCTLNFAWSENVCNCICRQPTKPCPCGTKWNPSQCKCIDSISCKSPLAFSARVCDCICPEPTYCPSRLTWNASSCQCECQKDLSCKAPWAWDSRNCQCICPRPIKSCPIGRKWDPRICQCACLPQKFSQLQILDQNMCFSVCQTKKYCQWPQEWNNKNCFCECPQNMKVPCSDTKTYNETSCQCECKRNETSCLNIQWWNATSCTCFNFCEPKPCVAPFVWIKRLCQCGCPELNTRTAGRIIRDVQLILGNDFTFNFNNCQPETQRTE
jgi:hypothetical protein